MHNLKKALFTLCVVFIGFFSLYGHAYALSVTAIRFGEHGNAIRIVLDLDQEADFRAVMDKDPVRLMIDMPALSGKPMIGRSEMPNAMKDIRLEPLGDNHSRISFLLTSPGIIRSAFLMPAEADKPARLVVDLAPASEATFAKEIGRARGTLQTGADTARSQIARPTLPALAGSAGIKLDPVTGPKSPTLPKAATPPDKLIPTDLPLIMIDAGHGGQDSGAVGSGVQEKDVTLAVAREVKTALEATGRYQAALTRDKDVFIRLGDRVKIARAADADLFVSIHADSVAGAESARGASFYTLSAQASDVQSARLAARENQADLLGGVALPTNDPDVKEILIDLAMRETTHQSKAFAGALIKSFQRAGVKTVPSPARSAGFMVLKAPDVPSVLVELGFLSNRDEAAKLGDATYRADLGRTVAEGIDAYFRARKK